MQDAKSQPSILGNNPLPIPCEYCGVDVSGLPTEEFNNHMAAHNGGNEMIKKHVPESYLKGKKEYVCDYCGKVCKNSQGFSAHKRFEVQRNGPTAITPKVEAKRGPGRPRKVVAEVVKRVVTGSPYAVNPYIDFSKIQQPPIPMPQEPPPVPAEWHYPIDNDECMVEIEVNGNRVTMPGRWTAHADKSFFTVQVDAAINFTDEHIITILKQYPKK